MRTTGIQVIVWVGCLWMLPSLDKCDVAEATARVKAAHAPSVARAALTRGGASVQSLFERRHLGLPKRASAIAQVDSSCERA